MKRSTRNSSKFTVPDALLAAATASTTTTAGNFSTRFSMPSLTKRVEKLNSEQRSAIQRVGFGNLLEIPNQTMSKSLLAELMNRWNPKKRVFELQSGEISITLMDVALILGLRVVGEHVVLNDDEPLLEIEEEFGASLGKRKIAVSALESKLESLDGVANEDFVRAFLLYLFGTFLFPSTNGKVDSRYLCYMKNLDCVGQFAWGAAVLEDLLGWLEKRKEMNVQYVGGCLIFLQIWSYEHIDIARPNLLNSSLVLPRACRWENGKSHQRQEVTAKFKELHDHQIIWKLEPSLEELKIDVVKELLKKQNEGKELPASENAPNNDSILNEDGLRSKSRVLDPIVVKVKAESETDTANEAHRIHEHNTEQPQSPHEAADIQIDNTAHYPSTSNSASETRNEEDGLRSGSQVLDTMDVKVKLKSETDSANKAQRINEHNVKVESETDSANKAHRIHENKRSPHKEAEIQIDSTSQYPSTSNSALETHNHDDDLRTKNKMLEEENMELRKELEKHKCEIISLKNQLLSTLSLEEQIVELKQENDSLRRKNESSDDLVDRLERILLDEGY